MIAKGLAVFRSSALLLDDEDAAAATNNYHKTNNQPQYDNHTLMMIYTQPINDLLFLIA